MKTAISIIGYLLVALGIMAMAGSAGDCDGKCVENANTIMEMLTFAGIGLAMFLFGFMLILQKKIIYCIHNKKLGNNNILKERAK